MAWKRGEPPSDDNPLPVKVMSGGSAWIAGEPVSDSNPLPISAANSIVAGTGIELTFDAETGKYTITATGGVGGFEPVVGEWTPGLTLGGGNTDMVLASVLGDYVKIPIPGTGLSLVWVTGNLFVSTKGSSTGSAIITGLPFIGDAPMNASQLLTCHWLNVNLANAGRAVGASVNNLAPTISLSELGDQMSSVAIQDTQIIDGSRFTVTGFYLTTE